MYEQCRQLLAEELGAYPSPETESIYRGLLEAPSAGCATAAAEAPPADAAPVAAVERGSTGRVARVASRKRVAVAALAVAVTAAAVAGIVAARSGGESQATAVAPNSIVALDPSGSIAATVPVGARPVAIASGAGALWVGEPRRPERDASRRRVATSRATASRSATRRRASPPRGPRVWVTDGTGDVSKIDPRYDRVTFTRPLRASVGFFGGTARPALAAFGSIWIVSPDGVVLRVDPASSTVVESVAVGNVPSAIAAGAGSVWVTNSADGTVTRIDPETLVPNDDPGRQRSRRRCRERRRRVGRKCRRQRTGACRHRDERRHRYDAGRRRAGRRRRHADRAVGREQPRRHGHAPRSALRKGVEDDPSRRYAHRARDRRRAGVGRDRAVASTVTAGGRCAPHDQGRLHCRSIRRSGGGCGYDDVREFGDVPRQAGARGIAHRPGGRRGRPGADGRRDDLHVQDPPRLPLLAAVERGGHRDDVQVDDRASRQPALGVAAGERTSAESSVTTPTRTGKAREISGIVARGRTLTIRLSRPDGGFLADLASRLGLRRSSRHARRARDEQHSLRGPLLRGVLHAAPAAGSAGGTRTTAATARIVSSRSWSRSGSIPRARSSRSKPGRPTTRSSCRARRGRAWSRRTVPAAKPPRRGTSSTSSARRWELESCT